MKRLDDDKVSLVEFLRSIKFARHASAGPLIDNQEHFAGFNPRARTRGKVTKEERSLVRSNN